MPCYTCEYACKNTLKCKRPASCRVGCKLLCWQHARMVDVFGKRGSKCNTKMLDQLEVIRRPLKGLGKNIYGISGSLTVGSMKSVFDTMSKNTGDAATFVDIGAADGYAMLLAMLYGYRKSYGIEYSSTDGLKYIYDHLWQKISSLHAGIFKQKWSPKQPRLDFGSGIAQSSLNGTKLHVFSFWDGFTAKDSEALLSKLRNATNIERICLVRRASRQYGTFAKLQTELPKAVKIKELEVIYEKGRFNATIFKFT